MCCAGSSPDATNDLHPWNVLGDGAGDARFYDWGDCVVAHPFAAMLVPLGFLQHVLGVSVDDPDVVRARHAYLRVFAGTAPGEDLATTLEVACRVTKVARVLTWDRALQPPATMMRSSTRSGDRPAEDTRVAARQVLCRRSLIPPEVMSGTTPPTGVQGRSAEHVRTRMPRIGNGDPIWRRV
jgi:hypothetical protein